MAIWAALKGDEMNESQGIPVKRAFLFALIISVVLSALLGIVALLSGRFGWLEIRILLTTVTVSVASIGGLGCGAYLATKRGQWLPLAGIAMTLVAAVMVIAGIWLEPKSDVYWKIAGSLSVFAVACAHLSLLSMVRLAEWFLWSLMAAYVVIFGVASLIVVMIFFEPHEEGMFQLVGVAAIVDAAITILIPIFHWLSRAEFAADSGASLLTSNEAVDAEIARLKQRIAELERSKQEERPT